MVTFKLPDTAYILEMVHGITMSPGIQAQALRQDMQHLLLGTKATI